MNSTSRNMTKEIQEVFATLPPNFFGHVEVHFKNGVPGFAKVVATKHFANSKGENPGSYDTADASNRK
jgi:hypothetical protein